MNRVLSVDLLRGFSLVCMVLIHFMIYWGNAAAMDSWLYFALNDLLGDWGAAGFLMMMGISQVLSAAKAPTAAEIVLFKKALLRSIYLFVVGLIMLALAWGPEQIWQWDILTLMGFATLVLYGCRFLPSWLILLLGAAIALATPWLRGLVDPVATWGGAFLPTPFISDYVPGLFVEPAHEFPSVWQLDMILQGFLISGTFPIFPWLLFPLLGFVLGRRIVAQRLQQDLPLLLIVGGLATALGLAGALASLGRPGLSVVSQYITPLSFYPDSFTMLLCQLGIALIVFALLYYWWDVRPRAATQVGFWGGLFSRTSRYSLTFYFLHYQLIGWPLLIAYAFTGMYRIFDFADAWLAFVSGLVAVTLLELLLALWARHDGKYSLEWGLALLTARLVRVEATLPTRPEVDARPSA
jgi:uncharacterized membrane protein